MNIVDRHSTTRFVGDLDASPFGQWIIAEGAEHPNRAVRHAHRVMILHPEVRVFVPQPSNLLIGLCKRTGMPIDDATRVIEEFETK